jgi:hypothetical protein
MMAIMPRGFDEHVPQMRVAGLGDPALCALRTTRVFGGNQAHERDQTRCRREARGLAELRGDRGPQDAVLQEFDQFVVAPGGEEGAQARRGAMERATCRLVRRERQARDVDQAARCQGSGPGDRAMRHVFWRRPARRQ